MKVELVAYNPDSAEHNVFMYKLMKQTVKKMCDDSQQDPVLLVQRLTKDVIPSTPRHFIVVVDGVLAGYIGALVDVYGVGYLEAAALREYQGFWQARKALIQFQEIFFKTLGRKLKSYIPIWNRQAEVVARSVGFRKEGIAKKESYYNGVATDMLELALFPDYVRKQRNVKK